MYHVKSHDSFGFSSHMVEKWRQMSCLFDGYHPSPIPSGGLEIMLMAKLTIDEKDAKILKYL